MPLKRAVLPLLTRTERLADDVGAANTVLFGGIEGEWYGANTDVLGMVAALSAAGVRPAPGDVAWVLGGGATAASALAAVAQLGVRDVVVAARRPDAVAPLVARAAGWGLTVEVRPWAQAPGCADAALTVATTPAGATDDVAAELVDRPRTGPGEPHGVLLDVVYAPWPTRLAAAWQHMGGEVVGGLALLVGQAAEQVRLMTGREPPVAAMQAAGRVALAVRP
jgi:shikimate dehydrogenase